MEVQYVLYIRVVPDGREAPGGRRPLYRNRGDCLGHGREGVPIKTMSVGKRGITGKGGYEYILGNKKRMPRIRPVFVKVGLMALHSSNKT